MRMGMFTIVILCTAGMAATAPEEKWIRQQVQRLRESDTDDWRKIPWTRSLVEAAKAGKRENRLLFVFTYEGNVDTGRC